MRLSLPAIIELINQSFSVVDCNINNNDDIIRNILFAKEGFENSKHTLHICDSKTCTDFVPKSNDSAILFIGESAQAKEKKFNYIVLDANSRAQDVFNLLSLAFEELRNWEDHIYDLFLEGSSLQEIFEASVKYTNNPIYLHDQNYRILAYAERNSGGAKTKTYPWLKEGKMPPEAVLGLLKSPKFDETFETTHATYWEKTGIYPDEYNYIYCNIKIEDQFIGRIFMDERNQPFRQIDFLIVNKLAEIVTKLCQTRKLNTELKLDYLATSFCELLDGNLNNQKDFIASLSEIGWSANGEYGCITIPLSIDDKKRHVSDSILRSLEKAFSDCYVFEYMSNIVAVINLESVKVCNRPQLATLIFPIVRDFHLKAIVSMHFNEILELPYIYRLNGHYIAKVQSETRDDGSDIFFLQDYLLDFALDAVEEQCPKHLLYPESLRTLIKYDKENNTSFVETLKAYIENDCSPAATSQSLFIHRSTFRYRFEKICELTSINFEDPQVRAHLVLAFLLMNHS